MHDFPQTKVDFFSWKIEASNSKEVEKKLKTDPEYHDIKTRLKNYEDECIKMQCISQRYIIETIEQRADIPKRDHFITLAKPYCDLLDTRCNQLERRINELKQKESK